MSSRVEKGSETDRLFQMMERKLLRLIMNPAMTATWIFGSGVGIHAGDRKLVRGLAVGEGGGRAGDDMVSSLAWLPAERTLSRGRTFARDGPIG
jgi:hypothetical protein